LKNPISTYIQNWQANTAVRLLTGPAFLLAFFFASCEEPIEVESDLVPGGNNTEIRYVEIPLEITHDTYDSLMISSTDAAGSRQQVFFGHQSDPEIGDVSAQAYFGAILDNQALRDSVKIGSQAVETKLFLGLNYFLGNLIGEWTGLNAFVASSTNGTFDSFSLEYILGQAFRLFAFAMGVEWNDTLAVGSLLGQKTAINEFVAYLGLSEMKTAGILSEKSIIIATYALCGFSNFSSIAIQVGGIGGMAPNQQGNLSKLGMRALLAATLACMMTATIAGALVE